jgi:hypothetical protein
LAGALAEESLLFEESLLLVDFLCFLWCDDLAVLLELDWSVEDEAGGSAASTGPAIKAKAMTGTSFLNIDVVSEK